MTTKKYSYNIAPSINRLSIQVSLNGLSFLIVTAEGNKPVFFKEILFPETHTPEEVLEELKKVIELHPELNETMKEITVLHENNLNALVPKDLFDENSLTSYLKFSTRLFPTDYLTFDELELYGICNVYVPYTNINNYLLDIYGEFVFQHTTSVFLHKILSEEKKEAFPKAYVQVFEKHFDLVVIKNKEIQFFNSFSYETPEDFIYYILFAYEQLQLSPEEVPLNISGKIEKEDALYMICYDYIRHVHLDSGISLNIDDADVPESMLRSKSLLIKSL